VTDPDRLGGIAAKAQGDNITTSTLGYGLGYDERIMSAIARGGSGNEHFAEEPDTAGALIAGEVTGLLSQTAQAASLTIRVSEHVSAVQVINDLPTTTTGDAVVAELGSFYSDETRKLVVVFDIPAVAALGLAQVATCEFTWVELPTLAQHTVTVPLHVNVVPGDEAAGRIPDPVVRTETGLPPSAAGETARLAPSQRGRRDVCAGRNPARTKHGHRRYGRGTPGHAGRIGRRGGRTVHIWPIRPSRA
jgi:Ca-activated chloride channel family protein